MLGPIDVIDDHQLDVDLGGPTQYKLLAILVARRGHENPIDELIAHLWPDELPVDPVASIRTYVSRLRSVLGTGAVKTGTGTYALGDVATDADRFEAAITDARRSSGSPSGSERWAEGLRLWRGTHAFGEHRDLDVVRPEADRLEELRAEATEAWMDARLAAGEGRELVADVEAATTQFPLREGFRAQQMTVLARAGRQADALRAFQGYRSQLTEIGLEPSDRLRRLDQQIAAGHVPNEGARRTLRGYQLGSRLGEGAFAVVHQATQVSVGREVAIKQVRSALADQPEFIRQFEAEAQLIARLEHPHIVPLYDYWREPGSAYLVMRHFGGGSMAGRLLDGPLPLSDVAQVVGQVATGLDAAHRAGVIHRDVKPGNILLDHEGNGYLGDFGIAVEEAERLDPEAWLSNGSPAYAAPEQLRREPVGPTADIYALGVTLYEALTAQVPFPTETTMAGLLDRQLNDPIPLARTRVPDLPPAVDAVIQRATAKDPEDRYPSADQFAIDLAAAAGHHGHTEFVQPDERNPYKGLAPFDETDANDFTGRDRLINDLLGAVERHRITVVVGPSGSGKSSVVRAGLIPALREGRAPGSDRWFVTTMVPGVDPFDDLENALLRVAVDPPPALGDELRRSPKGLARMIRRLLPADRQLLLVIDQFEELFTVVDDPGQTRLFLDSLVEALSSEHPALRLVATLRADFYDQPLRHPEFARLIREATVPVHPLAADELEKVITEPARAVGVGFEPGVVARITADVSDQPGALPLLQYALTELFDQRTEATLTGEAYARLGGVPAAIARRADEVYLALTDRQRAEAQRVFGRLVSLGDGTDDTRRRVRREELGHQAETEVTIAAFGTARLLSFDRDPSSGDQTVELAHEALIRHWPRLGGWLADDRDRLRIQRHLTETARSWEAGSRPPGDLYRGGRLEAAQELADANEGGLSTLEAEFLAASTEAHLAQVAAERRGRQRLQRSLTGVAVIAVLALIAGALAFVQRGRANDEAERANQERARAEEQTQLATDRLAESQASTREAQIAAVVSEAAVQAPVDVDVSLNLALLANAEDPGIASQRALLNALSFVPGLEATHTGAQGRESAESGCVSTTSEGWFTFGRETSAGTWEVVDIDPATGDSTSSELFDGLYCLPHRSRDGTYLAGPIDDEDDFNRDFRTIGIASVAERRVLTRIDLCDDLGWTGDDRFLLAIPDPGASCEEPIRLALYDPRTDTFETIESGLARIGGAPAFGGRFADIGIEDPAAPDGITGIRFDLDTLEQTSRIFLGDAFPTAVHQTSDGSTLVVPTIDGPVVFFDAVTGERVRELAIPRTESPFIYNVALSPDDELLGIATESGTLRVVDISSGRELTVLNDSDGLINLVWIDESRLAVLRRSGVVEVFDTTRRGLIEDVITCCQQVTDGSVARQDFGLKYDPTRSFAISYAAAIEGRRQRIDFLPLDGSPVAVVPISGSGDEFTADGELFFAEAATGGRALVFDTSIAGFFLAPDGTRTPIGSPDGVIGLIALGRFEHELAVLALLATDEGPRPGAFLFDVNDGSFVGIDLDVVLELDPSSIVPDPEVAGGALVGTAAGALLRVDDTGAVTEDFALFDDLEVNQIDVAPSGRLLAVAPSGRVATVDPGTGRSSGVIDVGRPIRAASFGRDAATVVIVEESGRVGLWEVASGGEIGVLFAGDAELRGAPTLSADRSHVWIGLGAFLYSFPLDPDRWVEVACSRRSRELSDEEWTALVPGDLGPRQVCAEAGTQ
ncbi:MAG: protein kinase [Actinomycetota bacterium]